MNKESTASISTGFSILDSEWGGLRRGEVILFAGRPGMGKTNLMIALCSKIGKHAKVMLLCLEYRERHFNKLFGAKLNLVEDQLLQTPSQKGFEVSFDYDITPAGLLEVATTKALDVVVIDYLQMMEWDRSSLFQDLKDIAQKAKVCILVTTQIGRKLELRPIEARRPLVKDLFETEVLTEATIKNVDKIVFLYRIGYYDVPHERTDTKLMELNTVQTANNRSSTVALPTSDDFPLY